MDYEKAANYWIERDAESVQMPKEALKIRISSFIAEHNTGALATSTVDGFVRNTPIEYTYVDNMLYMFSEGGLKFKCLKENKNVSLAIFDTYVGFGKLKSLQIQGVVDLVEPFTEEYLKIMEIKKIPEKGMRKLARPMSLIKVTPVCFDYLDSELKKENYASRQHIEVLCK